MIAVVKRTLFNRITYGIAFSIMLVAAVITLIDTPLRWIDTPLGWSNWTNPNDGSKYSPMTNTAQPSLPSPDSSLVPFPVSPPTPVPSLPKMLEAAKSVNGYSKRDSALRIVAETAVKQREYELAIKAGEASPTYKESSETLAYVARCAVEDGEFDFAVKAVNEIPISSIHDSTMNEVLATKSAQERIGPEESTDNLVSQECR